MKLLIISDLHYNGGEMRELAGIIGREKPDNLVLLGDNIDPKKFGSVRLYRGFISGLSKSFKLSRTILILGDEDYAHLKDRDAVLRYVDSLGTMNGRGEHFVYRRGNMTFFHGNIERSQHLEQLGKRIILFSVANNVHHLIPFAVSVWARLALFTARGYLFIGHIHFLGKVRATKTTFCGTLNRKAKYFNDRSLGYVVVNHSGFEIRSPNRILVRRIAR